MRYSKQRELVLQKVEQLCDHPTAEEIFDLAAKECPGLSLGTVYRNLNSLVEAGRGQGRPFRPHAVLAQPPLLQLLRRCRGRRRGRKAGDEAGAPPEGRRGGLRCGAVRPVRGLRRQAGTVKKSSCPPRPKRVYYKELFIV